MKAFVAFHLVCITVAAIPNPSEKILNGSVPPGGSDHLLVWNHKFLKTQKPIDAYLSVSGFWQYWDMFAPDPANTDIWVDADIVYRDGSTKHYAYPRIYSLPIPQKYPSERFRKFYERVNDDRYRFLWPQFALRIAYLNDNPSNPPTSVRLTRHWRPVAPPGQVQPRDYNAYMFYEYVVRQDELAQMRGMP